MLSCSLIVLSPRAPTASTVLEIINPRGSASLVAPAPFTGFVTPQQLQQFDPLTESQSLASTAFGSRDLASQGGAPGSDQGLRARRFLDTPWDRRIDETC